MTGTQISEPSDKAARLLVAICRCPEIGPALSEPGHPCHLVVTSQASEPRQVPEPWNGRLTDAPILFISSNPSISATEVYPTMEASDESLVRFFDGRFESRDGTPAPIARGSRTLQRDGSEGPRYSSAVRFLSFVQRRAAELLGRSAEAGRDYCITEVVHCKSPGERGVLEAERLCPERWLDPILASTAARVVVVLGDVARRAVERRVGPAPPSRVLEWSAAGGPTRLVVFMPHPNARRRRTFAILDPAEHARLVVALRDL
jgi:hypothetical protein